jgi:hypothetical protein
VALASHPSFEVRRRALAVVSRRSEPEARAAVVMALEPSQPSLASAVLASLSSPRGEEIVTAILGLLEAKGEWSLRAHAAEALGRAALDDARLRSEVEVALVRVAELDRGLIKRALDLGADGIVIPWIETAEQLARAVAFARYPPQGERGIGAERATGWGQCIREHTAEANEHVLVVPILESVAAVNAVTATGTSCRQVPLMTVDSH